MTSRKTTNMEMTMIIRAYVRRVVALSALVPLVAVSMAGAQSPASSPRWDAWLGCWRATLPAAASTPASMPLVCVARTNSSSAVEISTVQGDKVLSRDTIDASGQDRAIALQGCTGSKRGQWSADARRVYLRSEMTCDGSLKRTTTGILAISPTGDWLDVQGVTAGGNSGVRVTRYHEAATSFADSLLRSANPVASRQLAISTARTAAGGVLTVANVAEAVRLVDTSVVQAWIVERGARFDLSADHLVALANAGVPGSVTDVMIGVSYPEHFALAQRPASGVADGYDLSPLDSARLVSRYLDDRCYSVGDPLWYSSGLYDPCGSRYGYRGYGYGLYGYNPYGYSLYGRGYSSYGYTNGAYLGYYGAPIVVVRGEETPHGKVIKGVGYTSGGTSGSTGSSTSTTRSSGSGSSSGSSGSSGSSSGSSSSGSSGGRTAHPRPPQ